MLLCVQAHLQFLLSKDKKHLPPALLRVPGTTVEQHKDWLSVKNHCTTPDFGGLSLLIQQKMVWNFQERVPTFWCERTAMLVTMKHSQRCADKAQKFFVLVALDLAFKKDKWGREKKLACTFKKHPPRCDIIILCVLAQEFFLLVYIQIIFTYLFCSQEGKNLLFL